MHLSSGGPKNHNAAAHKRSPISRDLMVENTRILRRENDNRRLQIYESLLIQQKNPEINNQITGSARTLKLFSSYNQIPNQSRSLPRNNNQPNQNNPPRHNKQSNQNNVSKNNNQSNQDIQSIQNIIFQNSNQSNQNNLSQNNHQLNQNNVSQINNQQRSIQFTQGVPLSTIPTCQTQSNYTAMIKIILP